MRCEMDFLQPLPVGGRKQTLYCGVLLSILARIISKNA